VGSRLPAPFERDPLTPVDARAFAAAVDQDDETPAAAAADDDGIEPFAEIEPID
jgi:hypothetical protein